MAKRAVCIGINDYPGTGSDLYGCVNDANDWSETLTDRGFETTVLLDGQATKDAMAAAMREVVTATESGDVGVITYSGHGTWIPDTDADEDDQRDEALCPYDLDSNGPLTDDELYDIFLERTRGARVVLISDSCHSGSVARFAPAMAEAGPPERIRFLPPEVFLTADDVEVARRVGRPKVAKPRPHAALLMSGCLDTEYSYDANIDGRPNGAFTYHALKALKKLPKTGTYREWHAEIRKSLPSQRYGQSPNLQGSKSQKAWKVLA